MGGSSTGPRPRDRAATLLSAGLALLSLTVGFGVVDLLSPWILHEGTQVSDVGYGTLAGLVLPAGLVAQLGAAKWHRVGRQMVAAAALAYLGAGALAGEPPLVLAAVVVAAPLAVIVALRPGGGLLLARPVRPRPFLLVLAIAAWGPGSQYVLHMAFNQRDGVGPADAHLGLHHWAALSAAALAALLSALLAGLRVTGFVLPALAASASVLAWALACLVYPESSGALGRGWAALAAGWAVTFALVAVRESRRRPLEGG